VDAEVTGEGTTEDGETKPAAALGSYGHRMLHRMMKKTTQGMELETLKKEYQEVLDENSQLKEQIGELETKVRNILELSLTLILEMEQIQATRISKKTSVITDEDDDLPSPRHNRAKRRNHDWEKLLQFQVRKDVETQVSLTLPPSFSSSPLLPV
jgi:hypothetical protein